MVLLKHEINSIDRDYYIDKVNAPLLKAIVFLASRFPEPAMENVVHPNAKRLLEVQQKYLQYEANPRLQVIVKAVLRIVIAKLDHSPNYRDRISWFVEEVPKGWKARSLNHPVNDWNESKPYGGR